MSTAKKITKPMTAIRRSAPTPISSWITTGSLSKLLDDFSTIKYAPLTILSILMINCDFVSVK
jgi:hypothetical protein